jgi:putative addiction module component (TIGR02574 family)
MMVERRVVKFVPHPSTLIFHQILIERLGEINNLSVSERLLLVEDIWDHIADADDVAITLSAEQCSELDRRIESYRDKPKVGRYWNDVREEYFRSNH